MLWIYDDAIAKDLSSCIDPQGGMNNNIKMMNGIGTSGLMAQLQDDRATFPMIFIQRSDDTPLDSKRYNYARMHSGVATTLDTETNNVYIEKAMPIELSYTFHILTTNVVDRDELIKEILFRYSSMYYITAEVPYESKRKIRFGIAVNPDTAIRKESGAAEYLESGTLYEAIIELQCQGAVYLSYTPRHIQREVLNKVVALNSTTLNN